MPLPQEFSNLFEWPLVQKATSSSEIRDWFDQWKTFVNSIDLDVKKNRVKQIFRSDTAVVDLEYLESNSVINNGTLASQQYNMPLINADSVGMMFWIISDDALHDIVLQRSGTDQFYVNGMSVGTSYTVTGGGVIVVATATGRWLVSPEIPSHALTHQNGGADEINVAGLSGLLADPQTPLAHMLSHRPGASDEYSKPLTTVNSATYTVLSTDRILFVTYTSTAPVLITIPDALRTKGAFELRIIDAGNATVNNITFEDASGNVIARINTTESSMDFVSDGTAMRL